MGWARRGGLAAGRGEGGARGFLREGSGALLPWQLASLLPHSRGAARPGPALGAAGSACRWRLSALCGGGRGEGQALVWSRVIRSACWRGSRWGTEAQWLGKGVLEKWWVDAIHSAVRERC